MQNLQWPPLPVHQHHGWERGPQYCSLGLSFSQERHYSLFPPQGETLPHDCHHLAQFLPCSGISRQLPGHQCGPLVALSGRTLKSRLCSNHSRPHKELGECSGLMGCEPPGPYPHILHRAGKGPGRRQGSQEKDGGYILSSFQCLPEKIQLKEQTKTPLSLGKRRWFGDEEEVKHGTSPAGRRDPGGQLNP